MILEAIIIMAIIGIISMHLMARIDVEKPSEFCDVIVDARTQTGSALPVAGLTFATRLTRYYVVEDDPLGTNTISFAQNQSITARGILAQDQVWLKDAALSLDEATELTYAWQGKARAYGIAPIAKHDRLVVGANGMVRTFDALVDAENMVIASADCGITVTGDIVDLKALFAHGGA